MNATSSNLPSQNNATSPVRAPDSRPTGERTVVAVLFGGKSAEHDVSLASAHAVLTSIDDKRYEVVPVGISRQGDWFRFDGAYDLILQDAWLTDTGHLTPVAVSPNPRDHALLELKGTQIAKTPLDLAFPVLHGSYGEDGTVQGLFELAGIPLVGCTTLASALCMDKYRAHELVRTAGIAVPQSALVDIRDRDRARTLAAHLSYPLFVKPLRAGSSFGITRIDAPFQLQDALAHAFAYDDVAVVEEAVEGCEVGCAILGIDDLVAGRVDEIELVGGFFDHREKYHRSTARVHMPARIDEACERRVQATAKTIYRLLGCTGFARVDLFVTPTGKIVFNEVNTIPGLTACSRFPAMLEGIGMSLRDVLAHLLALYA